MAQITSRPLELADDVRIVAQHNWILEPTRVDKGCGSCVFMSWNGRHPDSDILQGWAPKHPLELAGREMLDGAMIATQAVRYCPRDEDTWKLFTPMHIEKCLLLQETASEYTEDTLRLFSTTISDQDGVQKYVKELYNKRLSSVKLAIVSDLCRISGFGSISKFQEFFESSRVAVADKERVVDILGIGGDKGFLDFPKSYCQWKARTSASLSKWRTVDVEDLRELRELARAFHLSHSDAYVASAALGEIEEVGGVSVQGKDIFFGTPQHRKLFQTFTGRTPVVVSGVESQSQARHEKHEEIEGDTSVITLARCDAYVSTWLCIIVRSAEIPKKRHPSFYNCLLRSLIPEAVMSILQTCLDVFKKDSSSTTELSVPFTFSSLKEACDTCDVDPEKVGDLDPGGAQYASIAEYLDGERLVHNTMPSSWHELDFYLGKRRVHTLHYYDKDDCRSYCVLNPTFVRNNICCWIGDVRDVFLGTLDDDNAMQFRSITDKDTFVVNRPTNRTTGDDFL